MIFLTICLGVLSQSKPSKNLSEGTTVQATVSVMLPIGLALINTVLITILSVLTRYVIKKGGFNSK
jgi:hypothetical protein